MLKGVVAIVAMLMLATPDGAAQLTARDIFAKMQTPALETLKRTTRLDMLDYWDADSIFKATNSLGGLSNLEKVTPGYLKVKISPVSTFEIKILPAKKGEVVMTIYSVGGESQAIDSQVSFYDAAGNQLPTEKYFSTPELKDFFDIPKGSLTKMKEVKEMIPFPTIEYSANSETDNISARLTVGEFMNVDDYNIIKLFLKPEITLEWKGEKYKYKK